MRTNQEMTPPANMVEEIFGPQMWPTPSRGGQGVDADAGAAVGGNFIVNLAGRSPRPSDRNLYPAAAPSPAQTVEALLPPSSPAQHYLRAGLGPLGKREERHAL